MRVHSFGVSNRTILLEDDGCFLALSACASTSPDHHPQAISAHLYTPGQTPPPYNPLGFHATGCLGLLSYDNTIWILAAETRPAPQGDNAGHAVETIHNVWFIPLVGLEKEKKRTADASHLGHPCHHLWKVLTSGYFYFSRQIDLSTRLVNRAKLEAHRTEVHTPQARTDASPPLTAPPCVDGTDEFIWNSHLLAPLKKLRDGLKPDEQAAWDARSFALPVIHGYYGSGKVQTVQGSVTVESLSRCGWKRAGVLLLRSGLDDEGNAATFVETETIISTANKQVSFVQIRGDIPLIYAYVLGKSSYIHWLSDEYHFAPSSVSALKLHFEHLLSLYDGPIQVIDIKQHGYRQSWRYVTALDSAQQANPALKDKVHYQSVRFPNEWMFKKSTIGDGALDVGDTVERPLEEMEVTSVDIDQKTGKLALAKEQKGVFRINSDNQLDRTAVAGWALLVITVQSSCALLGIEEEDDFEAIKTLQNQLFATNCDTLALIYSGAKTTCSSFLHGQHSSVALGRSAVWEERRAVRAVHGKHVEEAVELLTGQRQNSPQPVLIPAEL
ncbi:hypothetical protein JCM11641_003433 [Rhodosporidiobolus odoratus]